MGLVSSAQFNDVTPSTPSISTASSSQLLQINNDLYNGKVNTSIPILNYDFEGIQFPITLNYSGGNGIKTDEMPTWVGLGWSLQAGGFVHRTVRGKPDEARDFTTEFYQTKWKNTNGDFWYTKTPLNSTDYSYFTNKGKLNSANWSSVNFINSILPTQSNYPGSIPYMDASVYGTLTISNEHPAYDLVPDEFTFSVCGISGKFYLNQDNKWIVTSSDGVTYDVEVFASAENIGNSLGTHQVIKYLILTSNNGIKYYFGNSNGTYNTRLYEYSRSSYANPWVGSPENSISWYTGPLTEIVPHTWYLSKVENVKTGSSITLDYIKPGIQFYKNRQAFGSHGAYVYKNLQVFYPAPFDPQHTAMTASSITKIATQFFVLNSINFPNGTRITFESSNTNQMSTDESIGYDYGTGFKHDLDFLLITNPFNQLFKLDKIKLKNNDIDVKQFEFSYTGNDLTHRLKLSSLQEINSLGEVNGKYDFGYNPNMLPAYASGKTDHWGYYNNKDFFESVSPPYDNTNLANFSNYKEPDYNYVQNEILQTIKYPTGGTAEFVYEPNTYSKKRDPASYVISSSLGSNITGGGLRIQKINYYTNYPSKLEYTKQFDYSISGGSSLSSGILSSPPPIYTIPDDAAGPTLRSQGFNPTYYSGNPVTYTNVTEKILGNGSTNYLFTNYDNGQNDELPILSNSASYILGFEYLYKNNAYKRGKLKTVTVKNELGTILTNTDYQYDHDFSEAGKSEVRSIYNKEQGSNAYWYGAVSDRVYNDNVLGKTETISNASGSIVNTSSFTYDSYGNVLEEKFFDSRGFAITTRYKYAYQFSETVQAGTDAASAGIRTLLNKNYKSAIIEQIQTKEDANGVWVIGGTLNIYAEDKPFIYKVYKLQANKILYSTFVWSTVSGTSFTKDANYFSDAEGSMQYTQQGKVVNMVEKNGVNSGFLWNSTGDYIIAKVVNAKNTNNEYIITPTNVTISIGPSSNYVTQQSYSFTQYSTGNVSFSLSFASAPSTNAKISVLCTLSPGNYSQNLCINAGSSCTSPTSATFTNVPLGNYVFTINVTENTNTSASGSKVTFGYNNRQVSVAGIKEFFYEGFEDNVTASRANPYAGKKCLNGDFLVSFTKPNSRNYKVNYHYLEAGIWKNMTKDFVNNMTLGDGDAIDEVRVYPADAFMTTYTYAPLIGMTSETDPNGKSSYYEYDNFQRLVLIRDQEKNILKQFCYNYAGQPENCNIVYNSEQTATYYKSGCGCLTGSAVTYTVPAKTYSASSATAANQLALNEIAANGQAYADAKGTCYYPSTSTTVKVTNSNNEMYTLNFHNTCINTDYYFTVNPNVSNSSLGTIPPGNYNVTFVCPLGTQLYTYSINGQTLHGNSGTIVNVIVDGNAIVTITP